VASSLTIASMAKLDSDPRAATFWPSWAAAVRLGANHQAAGDDHRQPRVEGMGTTLTALFLGPMARAGETAVDSRGYLLRYCELY